jgi:hypothetical protein
LRAIAAVGAPGGEQGQSHGERNGNSGYANRETSWHMESVAIERKTFGPAPLA